MHGFPPPKPDLLSTTTACISLLAAITVAIAVWQSWDMYIRTVSLAGMAASFFFVFRQIHLKRTKKDHPYKWDVIQASVLPIIAFLVCLVLGLRLHIRMMGA